MFGRGPWEVWLGDLRSSILSNSVGGRATHECRGPQGAGAPGQQAPCSADGQLYCWPDGLTGAPRDAAHWGRTSWFLQHLHPDLLALRSQLAAGQSTRHGRGTLSPAAGDVVWICQGSAAAGPAGTGLALWCGCAQSLAVLARSHPQRTEQPRALARSATSTQENACQLRVPGQHGAARGGFRGQWPSWS